MEIETLRTMNEGMHPALLMVMKIVALITITLSSIGLAVYLLGIGWLCLEEMRLSSRGRVMKAPDQSEPNKYRPLTGLSGANRGLRETFTGSVAESLAREGAGLPR